MARFLFFSVLLSSDARPQIEVVPINGDLTLGAAVVKQTASFPKPAKAYTLPETKTEGPAYGAKDFISGTYHPPPFTCLFTSCTGVLVLRHCFTAS